MVTRLTGRPGLGFIAALILTSFFSSVLSIRTEVVTNCNQLKAALKSRQPVDKIIVNGNIRCTRSNWSETVVVGKNLLITGGAAKPGKASIDWANTDQVITLRFGVMLTFKNLILIQDFLEVGSLNVDFLSADEGAEVTFKGVAVGVRSCPQPIGHFDMVLENLTRPAQIQGVQEAKRINSMGLRVVDVAFTPSTSTSLWRMCNTMFLCSIQSPLDGVFDRVFAGTEKKGSCPGPTFEERVVLETGAPQRKIEQPGDSNNIWLAALTTASTLVLVVLMGLVFHKFIYPHIRGKNKDRGGDGNEMVQKDEDIITNKVAPVSPVKAMSGQKMKLTDIELGAQLGRGGYGIVYQGYYQGIPVAIKVIDHEKGKNLSESGVPLEAYLSQQMYHINIVQTFLYQTHRIGDLYGGSEALKFEASIPGRNAQMDTQIMSTQMSTDGDIFSSLAADSMTPEEYNSYRTFLVLEFCDAGPLSKAIREGVFLYSEAHWRPRIMDILLTVMDIAKAMSYLHSKRIIHGDLKPENVLLKSDVSDSRGYICKVGDFGLSRFLATNTHIETFTLGTVTHMPPELLKNGILTPAADVYSFGMLFWRIMSGQNPFRHMTHNDIMVEVVSGRRPDIDEQFPIECTRLIQDCWQQDHKSRPTFMQVVERLKDMMAQVASVQQAPQIVVEDAKIVVEGERAGGGISSDDGFTSECSGLVSGMEGMDKGRKTGEVKFSGPLPRDNVVWAPSHMFLSSNPPGDEDSDAPSETHTDKHKRWDSGQSVDIDAFGSTTDLEVIEENAIRAARVPPSHKDAGVERTH